MKKTVSWIVVADHQHAKAYVHDGPGHGLVAVAGWEFATHLAASRDIVTDRPGRKPGTGGSQRAVPGHTDPHREAGRHFLHDVADALAKAAAAKTFERLVLIAPPRALGELRDALPDKVRALVIAERAEDLTKETPAQLAERLGDVLPV